MVYPKEKIVTEFFSQTIVQALKLIKQSIEMVCIHSSRVQVCIYGAMC